MWPRPFPGFGDNPFASLLQLRPVLVFDEIRDDDISVFLVVRFEGARHVANAEERVTSYGEMNQWSVSSLPLFSSAVSAR